jgi:hypothetical protein
MNDDEKPTKRIDVWLTAGDLESLNFIRYKHGGASKATTIRACIRIVKHWIDTGKIPEIP